MMAYEQALDRCLRQLLAQGKKHGGYITYQVIAQTFHDKQCDTWLEALDWIYARLTSEGIKLVDQLPSSLVTRAEKKVITQRDRHYRRQAKLARKKHKYRPDSDSTEESGQAESTLCPEEAIDKLLFQAETRSVQDGDLLTIIQACRLSASEFDQLIEYLWLHGIEFSSGNPYQIYRNAKDGEIDNTEKKDFLIDPVVKYYFERSTS